MPLGAQELERYLAECRELVLREIRRIIPAENGTSPALYDLVMDYPLRSAKALRPSLCIATCRALGGMLESVLPSAAVLELYHNAFLIHDDIEDDSLQRRGEATLHLAHGVPIAINVGDTMLAMALDPLLDNMRLVGMGKALRVLRAVARMARESAEGQAIELDWVRRGAWLQADGEYFTLVTKKSAWYTFITPMLIGAILSDCPEDQHRIFVELGTEMGIAFQIQDDALNLIGDPAAHGKELAGDLWEGKHTLILMHAMRSANEAERREAERILAKPRRGGKSSEEVQFVQELIDRCGSVRYAQSVARLHAERAQCILADTRSWLEPSVHRGFIEALLEYVVERDR